MFRGDTNQGMAVQHYEITKDFNKSVFSCWSLVFSKSSFYNSKKAKD